jgi:hypothetical protein
LDYSPGVAKPIGRSVLRTDRGNRQLEGVEKAALVMPFQYLYYITVYGCLSNRKANFLGCKLTENSHLKREQILQL